MPTKILAAAALLASLSVLQTPALAQNEGRAQLRLTIVDETNAPLPNAVVTVFTMYGPRTVNTDEKGVVVFADLPAAMTQWWARTPGHLSSAEATRLKPGENTRAVTLHTAKSLTETGRSESGS
jgi:hypothetical protein